MKLYVADYHGDTTHLGTLEHGAYLLLLMAMWRAGGKLPADDAKLAKLAKVSPDQWAEIRPTILEFFRRRGGQITHKRISEEMARYETVSLKRKAASEMGVIEKRNKNNAKPLPNGSPNADHLVTKPKPEPEPKKESIEGPSVLPFPAPEGGQAAPRTKGSRLKDDWKPSAVNLAYAVGEGFTEREAQRMAESFRDYWIAIAGAKGVKLDWSAAWRTWARNERDRRGQRNAAPKRQSFV